MPPKQEPQNTRLWNMVVAQAKQKFRVYPSMAASKWVHEEYTKRGGRFVTSQKDDDRHDRKTGRPTREAKKEDEAKKKAEPKKKAPARKK